MSNFANNTLIKIKIEKDIIKQFDLLRKLKDLPPLAILKETKEYRKLLNYLLDDMGFIKDNLYKIDDEEIERKVHTKVKKIELFEGIVDQLTAHIELIKMLKDDTMLPNNSNKDSQMTKKDRLNIETGALSMLLNTFPRGSGGLISEKTRKSEEYQKVKKLFDKTNRESIKENQKNVEDKSQGKIPMMERMAKIKKRKKLEEKRYYELIEELGLDM